MLLEMSIKNFILIENLNITFSNNLNIFSGETGSGKSMIFDALNIGLGEKANGDCVRKNSKKTVVQLVFLITDSIIKEKLLNSNIDLEDDLLIITREINTSGRTIIRMNDKIYTLSTLRMITSYLMDIHGQHAHQSLLYPKNHITLLDSMGDSSYKQLSFKVKESYGKVIKLHNEIKNLTNVDNSLIDIDYIKYQMNEIESFSLTEDDENKLEEKYNFYKNIENIQNSVNSCLQIISGNHEISGLAELTNLASKSIDDVVTYDIKLKSIFESLNSLYYQYEDITTELRIYLENVDIDEKDMFETEQRMNAINELKIKYGKSIKLILSKYEYLKNQLIAAESKDKILNDLNIKFKNEKEYYNKIAKLLSDKRKKISLIFSDKIIEQLELLNMKNCKFEVKFANNNEDRLSINGIDKIEFLISTNPGMGLNPLAKIASGGEISRVMLAIKILISSVDTINTLVFDEIDTGISGTTALIVGKKLYQISKKYQIICITHLPQIAIMADSHFLIDKFVDNMITTTTVNELSEEKKLNEIARMLSGNDESKISIENAKEMFNNIYSFKSKF